MEETRSLLGPHHGTRHSVHTITSLPSSPGDQSHYIRPQDQHVSYGSLNGAVAISDASSRSSLGTQNGFLFRRLQPGMLTTLSSQFESLDYQTCENKIFKDEIGQKTPWSLVYTSLTRWVIMFFIGVCTALIGCTIDICIAEISKLKYVYLKHSMEMCVKDHCLYIPYLQWLGISMAFAVLAAVIVTYGEPVAAGSGIPLVKCYLNGINVLRINRIRTLIVKTFGVTCSVLGELAVGKEGPMVHSGSIVAAGLSQGKSSSMRWDSGFFKEFRSDNEKRDFVTGGVAAGVAAAFGAPVGGVLFSLEEGSSFWNQGLTWRIFFCSMVSAFTLNAVLSTYHGQAGQMAFDGLLNFGKFKDLPFAFLELPIFVSMGIIGGLSGALFNQMNYYLSGFRRRWISTRWAKIIEVMVVCAFTVSTGFIMIYLIDDCKAIGEDNVQYPIQMFCKDGEFNAVAAIWFQTPEASVRALFHDQPGTHNPFSVGLFFLFYFILSCWTYGLSISSGIFIPALLSGAAWGRLFGLGLYHVSGKAAWADPGKYALIGASAQLGGIVRVTLSLAVILIETTGNLSLGLGLMMTLLTAKLVGDIFNAGIYDMHVQLTGLPMLSWAPPPLSHNVQTKQIMSAPVVVLRPIEKVSNIMDILESCPHQGFPVVDDRFILQGRHPTYGTLRGLILRSQLKILLREKAFCSQTGATLRPQVSLDTFRTAYPRYPALKDIKLTDDERSSYIDLRPFYNPTPYTIHMNSSYPKVFELFRGLGLRHLIVTDDNNEVVGIVTRKNLARYRAHVCCGNIDFVELPVGDQGVEL